MLGLSYAQNGCRPGRTDARISSPCIGDLREHIPWQRSAWVASIDQGIEYSVIVLETGLQSRVLQSSAIEVDSFQGCSPSVSCSGRKATSLTRLCELYVGNWRPGKLILAVPVMKCQSEQVQAATSLTSIARGNLPESAYRQVYTRKRGCYR